MNDKYGARTYLRLFPMNPIPLLRKGTDVVLEPLTAVAKTPSTSKYFAITEEAKVGSRIRRETGSACSRDTLNTQPMNRKEGYYNYMLLYLVPVSCHN